MAMIRRKYFTGKELLELWSLEPPQLLDIIREERRKLSPQWEVYEYFQESTAYILEPYNPETQPPKPILIDKSEFKKYKRKNIKEISDLRGVPCVDDLLPFLEDLYFLAEAVEGMERDDPELLNKALQTEAVKSQESLETSVRDSSPQNIPKQRSRSSDDRDMACEWARVHRKENEGISRADAAKLIQQKCSFKKKKYKLDTIKEWIKDEFPPEAKKRGAPKKINTPEL